MKQSHLNVLFFKELLSQLEKILRNIVEITIKNDVRLEILLFYKKDFTLIFFWFVLTLFGTFLNFVELLNSLEKVFIM